MKITVETESMTKSGLATSALTIDVAADATAGQVEAAIRERNELITGWRISSAPAEFVARIAEESAADRAAAIRRWNEAVIETLPRVIADLEAEAVRRGGNWGAKAIRNASASMEAAHRCLENGTIWGVGTEISRDAHHVDGVSLATWSRVHGAAPYRLPLGLR